MVLQQTPMLDISVAGVTYPYFHTGISHRFVFRFYTYENLFQNKIYPTKHANLTNSISANDHNITIPSFDTLPAGFSVLSVVPPAETLCVSSMDGGVTGDCCGTGTGAACWDGWDAVSDG